MKSIISEVVKIATQIIDAIFFLSVEIFIFFPSFFILVLYEEKLSKNLTFISQFSPINNSISKENVFKFFQDVCIHTASQEIK